MKGRSVSLSRYQRDLEARGLRPNTVRTYVRTVADFLQALGGPPSRAREKDVRNYVVVLLQQQRASSSVNVAIAAIACFYVETLRRPAVVARLRRVRVTHPLPTLLSGSEVMKLLEATRSAKYRAIFSLLYGAGLRLDEALHLRIETSSVGARPRAASARQHARAVCRRLSAALHPLQSPLGPAAQTIRDAARPSPRRSAGSRCRLAREVSSRLTRPGTRNGRAS